MDGLPCLAGRLPRGEGAEIAGVVAPGLTHDLKARIGGVLGDAEQDILLVVAQDDIVVRAVFLDEAGFEEQRFLSVVVESVSSEAACPIMATVFGVRAEASRK